MQLKQISARLLSSFAYTKEVGAVLLINLLIVIFIVLMQSNLPRLVPIYYGNPYGAEQLGGKIALTFPPIITMVLAIINSLFIVIIDDEFLKKVLLVSLYTATLLSAITVIKIISLVGSIF